MENYIIPKGECPYCGLKQVLQNPQIQPNDDVYFFTPLEEAIITDSFSEIVLESTCVGCGKIFHFINNIQESIANRKNNKLKQNH